MKFIYYFILALTLFACRSTRQVQTNTPKIDTADMDSHPVTAHAEDSVSVIRDAYAAVHSNRISFKTFSAKVDVDFIDGDGKDFNVNAHVRIHADSLIWISVTGPFGFEGMRALVSRDSVQLLDKQNKVYTVRSIDYLQDLTGLPLDLFALQDLIVGNPVFFDSTIDSYRKRDGEIDLLVHGDFFNHLLTAALPSHSIVRSKLEDTDISRNRTCILSYESYEEKKGSRFSTRRRLQVSAEKVLSFRLDFKQYEFNETLSFPFSIPKNYDRN